MFFDVEITEDLLTVPLIPPVITRQNAYIDLTSFNNHKNSNLELPFNTQVNINQHITI